MVLVWKLPSRKPDSYRLVHKFGRNPAVGTSFVPVSVGGIYRTPQSGSATQLRVKAGNVADTVAGAGARKVTIDGLDSTGQLIREELETNGASAGTNSTLSFMRVYRAFVSESGTYADASGGSHTADVVIENAAGTEDWLTLDSTDFARGQSEIAAYSIAEGDVAYITSMSVGVESNKTADVVMFQRKSILDAAAPYEAMRMVQEFPAVANQAALYPETPLGPFDELTDLVFMAKAATSANVTVDFEILIERKGTHIPEAYDKGDPLS